MMLINHVNHRIAEHSNVHHFAFHLIEIPGINIFVLCLSDISFAILIGIDAGLQVMHYIFPCNVYDEMLLERMSDCHVKM